MSKGKTIIEFEPSAKRVRAVADGVTLADSTRVRLLRESGLVPVYYFPLEDLRQDLMEASDHRTHCPHKGDASYWHIDLGERRIENGLWGYPAPLESRAELAGYRAFYWNKMDHWYEEDEEVFVHARDPKVRIDLLASKRRVQVVVGGEIVADSRDAIFLHETGLPTRYYLPRADVRADLLEASALTSACPYKGQAAYHALVLGDQRHENIVWYYAQPLPEVGRIEDRLCFFDEKVEAVLIDGERQEKPVTKWS
ncbi:MAG: DUF427 domain-containing protein [Pseudomonadota bacterium]